MRKRSVPLLHGDPNCLWSHLARLSPRLCRIADGQRALLCVVGPSPYIDISFYLGQDSRDPAEGNSLVSSHDLLTVSSRTVPGIHAIAPRSSVSFIVTVQELHGDVFMRHLTTEMDMHTYPYQAQHPVQGEYTKCPSNSLLSSVHFRLRCPIFTPTSPRLHPVTLVFAM